MGAARIATQDKSGLPFGRDGEPKNEEVILGGKRRYQCGVRLQSGRENLLKPFPILIGNRDYLRLCIRP